MLWHYIIKLCHTRERTECPEIDSYLYSQLILSQGSNLIQWGKQGILHNWYSTAGYLYWKRRALIFTSLHTLNWFDMDHRSNTTVSTTLVLKRIQSISGTFRVNSACLGSPNPVHCSSGLALRGQLGGNLQPLECLCRPWTLNHSKQCMPTMSIRLKVCFWSTWALPHGLCLTRGLETDS